MFYRRCTLSTMRAFDPARGCQGKGRSNLRSGLTGGDWQATTMQWHLNLGPPTNQKPNHGMTPCRPFPVARASQAATNYATNTLLVMWQAFFICTPQVTMHSKKVYILRVEISFLRMFTASASETTFFFNGRCFVAMTNRGTTVGATASTHAKVPAVLPAFASAPKVRTSTQTERPMQQFPNSPSLFYTFLSNGNMSTSRKFRCAYLNSHSSHPHLFFTAWMSSPLESPLQLPETGLGCPARHFHTPVHYGK